MSRKYPLARYHLPVEVNPSSTVCFQVEVPNDFFHIIAFKSQIYQLASAAQWANDEAHTALDVAAVWWKVFNNLKLCGEPTGKGGSDIGLDEMIRQNPDKPCELQSSVDGIHWCTFADLSLCIPAGSQPGSGSQQPPVGGGTACWHGSFTASNKWLLPYQVSAGDTITITNAKGSANDGSGTWFCPNGQTFFLGGCTGSTSLNGGDPAPTIPHGSLIAKIGSVYYAAYNTTITVPGGISFANVEFQINDGSLTDNYGDLNFDVCATNNAVATFSHTFDFAVTDGGFAVTNTPGSNNGVYVPGSYWGSNCVLNAGAYYTGISIHKALSSRTLTDIVATYDAAVGTGNSQNFVLYINGSIKTNVTPPVFGSNKTVEWHGSQAASTDVSVALNTDAWNDNSRCNTGYCHLKRLVVSGLGIDPF